MANLNLNTLELVSTLNTVPLNGSPSSASYNETNRDTLVDLSVLSGFINNTVIPLLNALPSAALLPSNAPVGLEGRTIIADSSDQGSVFFNTLTSSPLSVADALRVVNGIINTNQQTLTDLGVEVASLQARLASTNQNDISLALQNLSASLNQISTSQNTQNSQISVLQSEVASLVANANNIQLRTNGSLNSVQNILNLKAGSNMTLTADGGGGVTFASAAGSSITLEHGGVANGSQSLLNLVAGSNITITDNGSGNLTFSSTAGGTGTVTSVSLAMPTEFSVAGSPVSTAGTFTVTKANQTANRVYAGPSTGSPGTPGFRALVAADIPSLSYVTSVALTVPGILSVSGSPITSSGTLAISLATQTANTLFAGPGSGIAATPTFRALVAADIPSLSYVTSVQLAVPAEFSVSGGPITSSGTITIAKATQLANIVYAGPSSGGAAVPTFRSIVAADIPALSYVTSVALALPAIFSVSGSPVTSSGTLTATLAAQSGNVIFASPANGSSSAPTFRSLASGDFGAAIIGNTALVNSSLSISVPGILTGGGSVSLGGTLTLALATQSANLVFSGPTTGSAAAPTFRTLVANDVPGWQINPQSGTSYAIVPADNHKLITVTNSAAITVTLGAASGFISNFSFSIRNTGTSVTTINVTTSTINGQASATLLPGASLQVFSDNTNYTAIVTPIATGGINTQTTSYLATILDKTKLISMNGASLTLTLPATPPSVDWWISVQNIASTTLTISRNSLNIDGVASNVTLSQNQGMVIFTDGTNYFTQRGTGAVLLQHNGSSNGSQSTLNLVAGSNVTITDNGTGSITIAASATGAAAPITNLALTTNVVTITANNSFTAGVQVVLSGLTTTAALNGTVLTVISTGLSSTQFEANLTHANISSAAETGFATPTGGVTSVAVSVPSILTVSGSPITSSGTIAISLANQTANTLFAGPSSGSAAAPTFRSIVALDMFGWVPNPQAGLSYNIASTDYRKYLTSTNSSPVTFNLPQAGTAGFSNNFVFAVKNTGTNTLTISPAISTINGTSSIVILPGAGALVYSDNTNYFALLTQITGGGVNTQTISYTSSILDKAKIVSMNGVSITLTLPAAPPSGDWWISVQNVNSTNLTVSRNGLTIDGAASNITLGQNQGVVIYTDGNNYFTVRGAGVTSIALTVPSWLTVAGSPITTNGTLAVTATTGQTANQFIATPNGTTGAVSLRALVAGDFGAGVVPNSGLANNSVTITVPSILSGGGSVALGGTLALTLTSQTGNVVLASPSGGGAGSPTFRSLVTADIPSLSYVTSVGLSLPAFFTVTGTPVTSSGTLTAVMASQLANLFLASPSGSTGAPTFRGLASADFTSGIVPNSGLTNSSITVSVPSILSGGGSVSLGGTLTLTLTAQTGNVILASPSGGGSGTPTFRGIVAADLPVFVASGASHAKGAVPDPGSVSGTTRYLREDATWQAISSGVTLQHGGVANGSQTLLNLVAGSNITITDDGSGDITIASTGGNSNMVTASINTTLSYSATTPWVVESATGGSAGITITLPTAVGHSGAHFTVTKVDTGAGVVTVATTSSQFIDGVSTYLLPNQWSSVSVHSDGTNWIIFAEV